MGWGRSKGREGERGASWDGGRGKWRQEGWGNATGAYNRSGAAAAVQPHLRQLLSSYLADPQVHVRGGVEAACADEDAGGAGRPRSPLA